MRSIIRIVKAVIRMNQGVQSWERALWPWRTPQTPLVWVFGWFGGRGCGWSCSLVLMFGLGDWPRWVWVLSSWRGLAGRSGELKTESLIPAAETTEAVPSSRRSVIWWTILWRCSRRIFRWRSPSLRSWIRSSTRSCSSSTTWAEACWTSSPAVL